MAPAIEGPAPSSRSSPLGPLGPLATLAVGLLTLLSLSRLALAATYLDRLRTVPGFAWCFLVGLRMDVITVSWILAIPTMLVLGLGRPGQRAACLWGAGAAAAAAYMEIATFPFVAQYDSRPNRLFFEYLVHPREVLGTLLSEYKLPLLASVVLSAWVLRATWRRMDAAFLAAPPWGALRRLGTLPLALVVLFLGARSSLRHRAANLSTAAFSSDHLTNELALNSLYSLGYAIYALRHEMDPAQIYGSMPRDEVLRRVRRVAGLDPERSGPAASPLLHTQVPRRKRDRPLNLVVFLQESMGAGYVPCLGGMPLTPELCRLAEEGTLFTNLYATGTRTVRGLEAVVSGFLPTPGRSVVKLALSRSGFFTLGDLLRRRGYATEFVYGGQSDFDSMRGFFLGNGFDAAWDETTFEDPVFQGTWGVSDEDLVREANRTFREKGDRPFLGVILSTSNHSPFEFPSGRIELFEQPQATVHNAIKYADWAIGEFFRLARREAYFANTLFLVLADHDTRVYGSDLIPVPKFRIPAVLVGPDVPQGSCDRLASQIDMIPTLLGLLGLEVEHPVPGVDLLDPSLTGPGRAVLQFDDLHAYMRGDQVVVHLPAGPARSFRYQEGRLVEAAPDEELRRDALAHALLPGMLYRERGYRLP